MHERGLECIYCARLKLLPIVYEMESYGVTLSRSRLEQLSRDYRQQSQRYGRVCTNIARGYGYELTLPKSGNNKSLLEFCFGRVKDVEVSPGVVTTSYDRNNCLALVPAKVSKKTGAPSLDKQVLEHYESTLPLRSKQLAFLRALRNKRKRDTAINYLDGYQRYWRRWGKDTYVLHPSLNPTGTDTLRWSSSNPNEQNISKLEGFNLRYAFGPAPGRLWASLDYNNIELRIPAYESGEEVMIEIFERPDDPPYFGSYHLVNASIIYPEKFWPLAERKDAFKNKYKSTYYQWVKNFGFALAYGAVPESGTADRAAHKPGAQLMVMDRLKEHTKLNRSVVRFAERYGYVETLPDREVDPKRGYPLLCTRTENGGILPTVPLNYRIQGTACWVAARAMVKLKDYFRSKPALEDWHLILNVHDEVVLDFPADCDYKPVLRKVASIMESMGDCIGIPLTVGCELHNDNWSEGIDCG